MHSFPIRAEAKCGRTSAPRLPQACVVGLVVYAKGKYCLSLLSADKMAFRSSLLIPLAFGKRRLLAGEQIQSQAAARNVIPIEILRGAPVGKPHFVASAPRDDFVGNDADVIDHALH